MRNSLLLILLGCCALTGCGGGGSPNVSLSSPSISFSTNGLTFGDEVVGTASQPLVITLTNSGTAALTIASISAGANFAQTNTCGSTLAAGANCAINVTFVPTTTGSLSGTVSFSDSAAGSPQTVSVSGTGVTGTPQYTLTGDCFGAGPADMCRTGQDATQCPVGQAAITPTTVAGCLPPQSAFVDASTACGFKVGREAFSGSCVAQATGESGSCSVQGQECGAAQLPPCCSGLVCAAASDRAFCQSAGESASRTRSSWHQGLADRLR